MGLNLRTHKGDVNKNILKISNDSADSDLILQGYFNFPLIAYGTNNYSGGGSSYDGGRTWAPADTLGYNTQFTYIGTANVGSYTNLSPNLKNAILWSWQTDSTGKRDFGYRHLTRDGGRTWENEFMGETQSAYQYTHWNKSTNNAYIGGWAGNKGLKTTDGGETFIVLNTPAPGFSPINFDSSDDEDFVYCAAANSGSILKSTNGGTSWSLKAFGEAKHHTVKCDESGRYVIVYYTGINRYGYLSTDYAESFITLPNSYNCLTSMTRDANVITYSSPSTSSIYISNDKGNSWNIVPSPFGSNKFIFSNDFTNNEIYLWNRGSKNVYRINDEKDDIELFCVTDNQVWTFEPSQYGRGYVYSGRNLAGTAPENIYFSRNAKKWQQVSTKAAEYLIIV